MQNKLEIRIGDASLDLPIGVENDFFVTKRIHDIRNLETRDGDQSRELIIPRTLNNIRILGKELPTYRDLSNDESAAFTCQVLANGVTIILDGQLHVRDESIDDYSITVSVFGGAVKFYNILKDDSIKRLDLSQYNLNYTLANLATRMNTTDGFLFGYCSWLQNLAVNDFNQDYKPGEPDANNMSLTDMERDVAGGWFYLHTIFKKILDNIEGMNFDLAFMEDNYFKKIILQLPITQLLDNWDRKSTVGMFASLLTNSNFNYSNQEASHTFKWSALSTENPPGFYNATTYELTATSDALVNIILHAEVKQPFYDTITSPNRIAVYKNGEILAVTDIAPIYEPTMDLTVSVSLISGDKIKTVLIMGSNTRPATDFFIVTETKHRSTFELNAVGAYQGDYITISDWLPEITQKQFIIECLKFYHLIPVEGISAQSMKIRYIRDWANGSTANATNHWNEIKAFDKNGKNKAQGKTVTGYSIATTAQPYSNITDGNDTTYGSQNNVGIGWVRVDLGQIIEIKNINILHYYIDGRTFYETKTEVSADGINWTVLFDSATSGTYPETPEGRNYGFMNNANIKTQEIKFVRWDDILANPEQDLTENLDVSRQIVKQAYLPGYGKKNIFTYTADDLVGRADTRGEISMDSANVPGSETKVTVPFKMADQTILDTTQRVSAPLFGFDYQRVNDNKIKINAANANFTTLERHGLKIGDHIFVWANALGVTQKRKVTAITDNFSGTVDANWSVTKDTSDWDYIRYKKNNIDFQIGYATLHTGTITLKNGAQTQNVTNPLKVIFDTGLTWVELIKKHYRIFKDSIYKPYLVRAWFNIPLMKFNQMKITDPVYIGSWENKVFYINAIEQYKLDGSVRLELVGMIKKTEMTPSASFSVTPSALVDLGAWTTDDPPKDQIYTITNGPVALTIILSLQGDTDSFAIIGETEITLSPGQITTTTVQFWGANSYGQKNATLTFSSETANDLYRQITALVNIAQWYFIIPPTNNLGNWTQAGGNLTAEYFVGNAGTIPLNVSAIVEGDGFSVNGSEVEILPNQGHAFIITYDGADGYAGQKNGSITISERDGLKAPETFSVYAINEAVYILRIDPVGDVDLGTWRVGDPAKTQTYTLYNDGNIDLQITISENGTGTSVDKTRITLQPFAPQIVTLTADGTGVAPGKYTPVVSFAAPGLTTKTSKVTWTVAEYIELSVTPEAVVAFGNWAYGNAQKNQTYTVLNKSNKDVTVLFSNSNNSYFTLNRASAVLTPNASTTVTVTSKFTDTTPAGAQNNELISTVGAYQVTNAQTATVLASLISITPTTPVNLGTWNVGEAAKTQTFTITNTGTTTVTVTVTENGTGTSLNKTSVTVAPGTPQTVILSADGTGMEAGTYNAVVTFSAPNMTPKTRDITWTVAQYYSLEITPTTAVNFGNMTNATTAKSQAYTVKNLSNLEVTVNFSKTSPHFTINKTSATIAVGGSTTVTVTTAVTATTPLGTYSNTLRAITGPVDITRTQSLTVIEYKAWTTAPTGTINMGTYTGTPVEQKNTLTNTGNADLLVVLTFEIISGNWTLDSPAGNPVPLNIASVEDVFVQYEGGNPAGTYTAKLTQTVGQNAKLTTFNITVP